MFKLTDGEKFFLERRRNGETQGEAASALKVHINIYSMWERGKLPTPIKSHFREHTMTENEVFLVKRRRAGLTVKGLAEILGCSHEWVNQMERGETKYVGKLRDYWKNYDSKAR